MAMDTLWNIRWLFYVWFTFALHESTAETFIDEEASYLQCKKWDMSANRALRFRFKTFLSNALLLYMDDGGKTNFLRLELSEGKLVLTCKHGVRFPAMPVYIGENLNDLLWHQVLLERSKGNTTVTLGTETRVISSRDKTSFRIKSAIYFGGLPPGLNSVTEPSVKLLNRFVGCIMDIEMFENTAGQGKRTKAIVENSNKVTAGCTNMCHENNRCQNNGTCLNKFTATACDCTATGFRGRTCNEALPVLGLEQSDYVIFNRANKAISTQLDRIIFRFKTANQNGLLLECGSGRDYFLIELYRGSILLRWNLGLGELYVHVLEKAVDDNKWHSVRVTRNQNQLSLILDGTLQLSRPFPGKFISFDLRQGEGDVFIGGMPTSHFLSSSRSSRINFEGCLQEINFNGVDIVQGVVNGEDVYTQHGHPRSTCEQNPEPTTLKVPDTTDPITTEKSTTAASTTSHTPMATTHDSTYGNPRIPTSRSVTPCSDDEDDCDSDISGSGDEVEASGENRRSSGDNAKENNETSSNLATNNSSKKPIQPLPTNNPSVDSKTELVGEPDVYTGINCIEDDEDMCDNDGESGRGSANIGSAGSALPTTAFVPAVTSSNHTKGFVDALVKKDSSRKWVLIAGIIVVASLLVAFCIFAIWWLCKNKKDPNWNGMHNGSREKCLQAEMTDV